MRYFNKTIATIVIIITINSAYSQTISEIINNPDLNYFEMQEQINDPSKSIIQNADEDGLLDITTIDFLRKTVR